MRIVSIDSSLGSRLLVVSELHDTVVRDLTRAVMTAEQARLARPGAALARDLSALTTSVRTAVEQLRGSLRALSDAWRRSTPTPCRRACTSSSCASSASW